MKNSQFAVKFTPLGHGGWMARLHRYALLVRLDRPIGIYLLLWPTLWALWIAGDGNPHWYVVLVFVLGVVLMRSAGCAINDYADRDIDGHVARTQHRQLALGLIRPGEALLVFLVLALLAFLLVLTLNALTVSMSFVAILLASFYPFSKRFTYWPQLFLGLAFGWAVPMAFAAIDGRVPDVAWLLYLATLLWTLMYDTQYAMVDRPDDLKIGVKSTAIRLGDHDLLFVGVLQGAVLLLLTWIGLQLALGLFYYLGLLAGAGTFFYQLRLIEGRLPKYCLEAFLNNNLFGMAVFLGLLLDYLF
jgi:4-hydroxybenzoate polyprenyltransferase